jgi:hypothetical protein
VEILRVCPRVAAAIRSQVPHDQAHVVQRPNPSVGMPEAVRVPLDQRLGLLRERRGRRGPEASTRAARRAAGLKPCPTRSPRRAEAPTGRSSAGLKPCPTDDTLQPQAASGKQQADHGRQRSKGYSPPTGLATVRRPAGRDGETLLRAMDGRPSVGTRERWLRLAVGFRGTTCRAAQTRDRIGAARRSAGLKPCPTGRSSAGLKPWFPRTAGLKPCPTCCWLLRQRRCIQHSAFGIRHSPAPGPWPLVPTTEAAISLRTCIPSKRMRSTPA